MEDILKQYLSCVFTEEFFTVALDSTGCYLFTDCNDDNKIGEELADFKEQLGLSDKQISLCVIGRKSKYNYCSLELLPQYVLKAIQCRSVVIDWRTMQSIKKTFGIGIEIVDNCFADSILYKKIQNFKLTENAMDLSDDMITAICRDGICSDDGLARIGIPKKYHNQILSIIRCEPIDSGIDSVDDEGLALGPGSIKRLQKFDRPGHVLRAVVVVLFIVSMLVSLFVPSLKMGISVILYFFFLMCSYLVLSFFENRNWKFNIVISFFIAALIVLTLSQISLNSDTLRSYLRVFKPLENWR